MTTPINVNITSDISSGQGWHLFAPIVVPTLTTLGVGPEVPTRIDWAPGAWKKTHSLTTSVKHRSSAIVLAGHDCGWMITDEPLYLPPLSNAHAPMNALVSSRAVVYNASTVKMDGKETGLASWGKECPMLSCSEICPTPQVQSDTSFGNSLIVGATTADIDLGDFTLTMKIATGFLNYAITLVLTILEPAKAPIDEMSIILDRFFPTPPGLKDLVGVVSSGAVSAYASYQSGWKKPITMSLNKSTPASGYSLNLSYDPSTHQVDLGTSSTVGNQKVSQSIPLGPFGLGPTPTLDFDSLTPNTGFPNNTTLT